MEEFTDLVISDDAIVWCFKFCVGLLILLLMIIHLVVRSPYDILFPERTSLVSYDWSKMHTIEIWPPPLASWT
jgi:hypothetical protein